MNKIGILIIIGITATSVLVICCGNNYITEQSILDYLNMLPTFIGILLAGVLTSLAIILAIIGTDEMVEIREREKENNKEFYKNMSNNLKQNVCLILAAFLVSSFLSIFCISGTSIPTPDNWDILIEIYELLFVFETLLLASSFIATYDIINGMFHIFNFKYDISNKIKKPE